VTALVAQKVVLHRGERAVLDGVDMHLSAGEFALLAGRNGAGKSTLLRLLIGAERPERGLIALRERPLDIWEPKARARELAFVQQSTECPFEFTGRQLVTMGRYPHRPRNAALGADDQAAIERALASVDAEAFADRPVTTLSGGEQRRISVARALATEAPLMLLDEPTANLDLEHALQLVGLLRREVSNGRGVLVASHDLNLFASHCDRVMLLHEGRIVESGPPESALSPERVAQVFGVKSTAPAGYFPRQFRL